ncbi:MAG: hypothetical protein ACQERJ_08590 [Bacillota bacterium]
MEENNKQTWHRYLFADKRILSGEKFKLLRYLIILVLVGVFFMLIANSLGSEKEAAIINSSEQINENDSEQFDYSLEQKMEQNLKMILSQVSGVGEVEVNITLDTGPEYVYARDDEDSAKEIVEQDKTGGTRKTEQHDYRSKIVVLNQGGKNEAVVKKKIEATVRGVLVVAEGANNSYIKAELIEAVKVGLGIGSHKIKVLAKEGRD